MLTNEEKSLISELRSYNYLLHKYADMTENFAKSLKRLDDEIKRIDILLNEYHIPAIQYDKASVNSVPTSKNTRVLEFISEQECIIKRKELVIAEQKKSINKIVSRIEDVDMMLKKINSWERQFITHMYVESRCIEYMVDTYNYSRANIYKKATSIIKKMLKN